MKDDVKRSPKSNRSMGKGKIPGKVRMHPHTHKALSAVAVNKDIVKGSKGGTGNGLSGADSRY